MKNSTAIVVLSACLGLFSSLPAYSNQNTPFDTGGLQLPFVNTPKGIQDYANSANWGSRKKLIFSEVGDSGGCTYDEGGGGRIRCEGGYVKISDPLETKVCELAVWGGLIYSSYHKKLSYNTKRCSIK